MSNVVSLDDHRKKKSPPTPKEIASLCLLDVMTGWELFAKTNRLNDFVQQGLGIYAVPSVNYLADRNGIAEVEEKVGLLPTIFAPGTKLHEQIGWRVGLSFGDLLVETPDFPSEPYARCCGLLVFLKVKRELVLLNKPKI